MKKLPPIHNPPIHPDYSIKIQDMDEDELFLEIVKWYHKHEKMAAVLIAISALIDEQGLKNNEQLGAIREAIKMDCHN